MNEGMETPLCGPETVLINRYLLEELRDWLAAPQSTGGNYPIETHRAGSEGVDHLLVGIQDALGELVTCKACGNSWPKDRYKELRPVGASIGWCPSCGEEGEIDDGL